MDQHKSFPEIVGSEKHMLASIYSKGILHTDVMELYRKIRTRYEQILLNSSQMAELQEVEYHLWKLHYQLIDEFRKRIRQHSFNLENKKNVAPLGNANSQSNTDKGLEGFKSFLSEGTQFYQNLIVELRTKCGLPAEIFLTNKDSTSYTNESTKIQACQHTCHRLLICLGDLARYTEIVKISDACNWSTSAKYYLEATRTWPDSGNPHNQLALLATYVGDPFLALYHCVRSLAVKEPFPDAWRNVMLLFEENRSAKVPGLSSQMQLDFLNPSKRSYQQNGSFHNGEMEDSENTSEKFKLWPILVRTISFFFVKSSLEEFPSTLASAINRLEAMLSVDDMKLPAVLESYQNMDSSRRGPYRAIQLVSVFVFIAHSLTKSPEREESTEMDSNKRSELTPLAFAAVFICMGRLTERCLTGNQRTDSCPLLPAVVVFVEWLVGAFHTVESYGAHEKVKNALSYFFDVLADLLDQIGQNGNGGPLDYTALWEDHELRGFYPLIGVHESFDYTTHLECMDDYSSKNQCRFGRLFRATTSIVETTEHFHEWIPRNALRRLVKTTESVPHELTNGSSRKEEEEEEERTTQAVTESVSCLKIQPSTEEEEVILFKPITRRNSAPLYISKPVKDPVSPEGAQAQTSVTDEWLRRATSLSTGQNTVDDDTDSFSFYTSSGHSRPSPKQKEPLSKDLITTHPAGPPSLSAWVLSQGSEREPIPSTFTKQKLSPIDEIASTSFSDLAINETKDSKTVAGQTSTIIHDTSPFVAPTPSAPLLPDDAAWLRGNSPILPDYKNAAGNEADGILGAAPAAPIGGYMNRAAVRPPVSFAPPLSGLVDGYPPLLSMSSSEWLYHYRNSQNVPANHLSPSHLNAPPAFGNYHSNELSSFGLFDQWGNHLVSNPISYPQMYPSSSVVYGAEEPKRDKFFLGYQRPFPYVCGAGVEMNSEQPSLLQYLKEKERQMQPGSQLRNPGYMGNN